MEVADDINGFKDEDYECKDVCEWVDEYLDDGYTENQKRFFNVKEFVGALIDEDGFDVYRNCGDKYVAVDSCDISNDYWSIYMIKVVKYGIVSGVCVDKYYCCSDYDELYIIKKID